MHWCSSPYESVESDDNFQVQLGWQCLLLSKVFSVSTSPIVSASLSFARINTNSVVFSIAHTVFQAKAHPPDRYPAKFGCVLLYSPYLFGKKLFSMQNKLVNNKQTHFFKQIFFATIKPIDKRCVILINLWINPVVCWYCLLILLMYSFWD